MSPFQLVADAERRERQMLENPFSPINQACARARVAAHPAVAHGATYPDHVMTPMRLEDHPVCGLIGITEFSDGDICLTVAHPLDAAQPPITLLFSRDGESPATYAALQVLAAALRTDAMVHPQAVAPETH